MKPPAPTIPTLVLAVSGSRSIHDPRPVNSLLDDLAADSMLRGLVLELRLGDAAGVDAHALAWARSNSISRHICFADERKFGRWMDELKSHASLPRGVRSLSCSLPERGQITYLDGTFESAELSASWTRDGLTMAGSKRNAAMLYGHPLIGLRHADLLLAIHDGISPGTMNCIGQAELMNIEVRYEVLVTS